MKVGGGPGSNTGWGNPGELYTSELFPEEIQRLV